VRSPNHETGKNVLGAPLVNEAVFREATLPSDGSSKVNLISNLIVVHRRANGLNNTRRVPSKNICRKKKEERRTQSDKGNIKHKNHRAAKVVWQGKKIEVQ
jgi:hypothetical protein